VNRVRRSIVVRPVRLVTKYGGRGQRGGAGEQAAWGRREGRAQHGLLHPAQHERVVHEPDAAADRLPGVAGEGTPRCVAQEEAERRPAVDAERAVAQCRDGLVHGRSLRALGSGVDEQGRAEGAGQLLVGEVCRGPQEPRRVRARQAYDAEGAGEHLVGAQEVVGAGEVRHEDPAAVVAERLLPTQPRARRLPAPRRISRPVMPAWASRATAPIAQGAMTIVPASCAEYPRARG
jgi:hypothetical protein